MNTRTQEVKNLFDDPDWYLKKNFDISIRSLVVHELLGDVTHSRILDVGCGDGTISLRLLSMTNSVTLVDMSKKMLEVAKKNTPTRFAGRVAYINADLHSLRGSEKFDVVLCIGVLAHVASVEETVAKVSSLLRPGGRCILQVTDNDKIVGKLMNAYYSVHDTLQRYSRYSLNKLGLSQVVSLAHRYQLTLLGKRQYLSPFLGMGRLPNEWLFKYELFTLTHDWISKLGSETIGLYRKNSDNV